MSEQRTSKEATIEGMLVEENVVGTPQQAREVGDLPPQEQPTPVMLTKFVQQTLKYAQPQAKPHRTTKLVLDTKDSPADTLGAYGLSVDEVLMSRKSPLVEVDLRVRFSF
jgi:hypothetical protein